MRFATIMSAAVFFGLLPVTSFATIELYTGTIQIVSVSGKACGGMKGTHAVSLFLRQDEGSSAVSGFFGGETVTTGKFSGTELSQLDVRYPYHDDARAAGHFLSITSKSEALKAELRDRHLEPTEDDCNFDLARLNLTRVGSGEAAELRLKPVAALFEAQLIRSEAFALARTGRFDEALPLYEKALGMADPVAGNDAEKIAPYITGLANAYVKLGRNEQFSRLYDERIGSIKDEAVRTIFSGHRVRSLLQAGKAALAGEDYNLALENFRKAYRLEPAGIEVIAAVMMTQMRMKDYNGAVAFLEEALKSVEGEGGDRIFGSHWPMSIL